MESKNLKIKIDLSEEEEAEKGRKYIRKRQKIKKYEKKVKFKKKETKYNSNKGRK